MTRRDFLRTFGIASSALTISPFFLSRLDGFCQAAARRSRVYQVKNGDCFQNTAKIWEMLDGPAKYIGPSDIVVIKGNAQWPKQGYTHTGCIKGIIDKILEIPGFSGEILICDNIQTQVSPGAYGFDATPENRVNNWPDHNWDSLAADYQANGKPVATKRWISRDDLLWKKPEDGEGWVRSFFTYQGRPTYLSYPVFQSPLKPGRLIDMKQGVWENGRYTRQQVKTIFMPTLNNHGWSGGEDYAGITSAIKSFFGATEIHIGEDAVWNGYYSIHSNSFTQDSAQSAGELVGRFINTMYAPALFVTAAMYSGWESRVDRAANTETLLACDNPVTLDYVASKYVLSPFAPWLNPDDNNNTRQQILGCNSQGIGTIDPQNYEIMTFDFVRPTATRLDIERKMRDFRAGKATEQEVKEVIRLYMEGP